MLQFYSTNYATYSTVNTRATARDASHTAHVARKNVRARGLGGWWHDLRGGRVDAAGRVVGRRGQRRRRARASREEEEKEHFASLPPRRNYLGGPGGNSRSARRAARWHRVLRAGFDNQVKTNLVISPRGERCVGPGQMVSAQRNALLDENLPLPSCPWTCSLQIEYFSHGKTRGGFLCPPCAKRQSKSETSKNLEVPAATSSWVALYRRSWSPPPNRSCP